MDDFCVPFSQFGLDGDERSLEFVLSAADTPGARFFFGAAFGSRPKWRATSGSERNLRPSAETKYVSEVPAVAPISRCFVCTPHDATIAASWQPYAAGARWFDSPWYQITPRIVVFSSGRSMLFHSSEGQGTPLPGWQPLLLTASRPTTWPAPLPSPLLSSHVARASGDIQS